MKKLIALLMLTGCCAFAGGGGGDLMEELFGFVADDAGITFRVFSGGCTQKGHFIVSKEGPALLLTRTQHDWCKAYVPMGIPISYTWKEINVNPSDQKVVILNPIKNEVDVSLIE